jgi:hypothetical protein
MSAAQHTPGPKPHITETEAYWRAEAATALHIARADRRRPGGSVESIRMSEAYAAECEQRADAIAKATGS